MYPYHKCSCFPNLTQFFVILANKNMALVPKILDRLTNILSINTDLAGRNPAQVRFQPKTVYDSTILWHCSLGAQMLFG